MYLIKSVFFIGNWIKKNKKQKKKHTNSNHLTTAGYHFQMIPHCICVLSVINGRGSCQFVGENLRMVSFTVRTLHIVLP